MAQILRDRRRVLLPLILGCGFLSASSCAKLSQPVKISQPQSNFAGSRAMSDSPRLNLNTATADELEKLPGVGKVLAARIVLHRERYGNFRRAEHSMMVRGMSDGRFRAIREYVAVE